MSEDKKCGNGKFFLGAVLGAIAGTIAGVVIAPKSGEETRKDLKKAGDQAVDKAKKTGHKWFNHGKKEIKQLEAKLEEPMLDVEEDDKPEKATKKTSEKD